MRDKTKRQTERRIRLASVANKEENKISRSFVCSLLFYSKGACKINTLPKDEAAAVAAATDRLAILIV